MAVIEINQLQKNYGKHVGTRDVTFSVNEGEIFGFVGPNGAGKSTTLKILMNFITPQSGHATIGGLDVTTQAQAIKAFTGYVPSDVRLYAEWKVNDLIEQNASFYVGNHQAETQRLISLFEIDQHKRFHELSTGNKKKVALLCALVANPQVIILDEPTSGLDPVMQKILFQELRSRTANGATVLLSSHVLSEVEEYCDRVAFIKDGTILAITDLKQATRHKIVTIKGGNDQVSPQLKLLSSNDDIRRFRTQMNGLELLQVLSVMQPADFIVHNESMEQYFWDLYGKEPAR